MSPTPQKIIRIRREYNAWVANETLEDYALRYTPHSARKWGEWRVANTACGSMSFLALEAIGGTIALNYGFSNALWAILVMGLITFLTGLPIAVYAARHGLDMDLLTRGAGFGYLGSTVTSLIYASFTFIFFALEAAIMAQALQMALGWPMLWCYMLSSLVIIPLVLHGITLLSRLQTWTQPLWALLLVWPFVWFAAAKPELYYAFTDMVGLRSGSEHGGFDPLMFGAASAVAFSLVVQIGEQVDYLRFMPERTPENRWRWWTGVVVAGPGWIGLGMLKMLGGAFLAYVALDSGASLAQAAEPTHMYLAGYTLSLGNATWAIWVTVLFVVVSQVKINVTNAYAGSLAWSNFFARLTHSHPGRVVWLVFNVVIAMLLMTLGVFGALEKVLTLYSNVAVAWVGALVADLVINKPLGLSPRRVEFRRAYLYELNPVGVGAMFLAVLLALTAYAGVLGPLAQAFSPFIALGTALAVSPILAWATGGRFYLARQDASPWGDREMVRCAICENDFESTDMAACPAYGAAICSLCCSLESRCHDRCKNQSRAADQIRRAATAVLPEWLARRINFRVAQYCTVLLSLCAVIAGLLAVVYVQESLQRKGHALEAPFIQAFSLLAALAAVCAWWVVLAQESRRMAHDESERQTQLLLKEIDAHQRTDQALQTAKDAAESASQAKTRYVAGMTHELRTPLNTILGYAQILLRNGQLQGSLRESVETIQQSGQHMHGLIDGLLDLARIEAGRLRLDKTLLPFPEFLAEIERMVQPQAQAKGLAFRLETLGRVPAWVQADAKRLRQIVINLLGNAVRFTDHGQIVFRVDCRQSVMRLEVEDTGIGIAPQDQERIFMPFERGSAGRRSSESGTGLGLTITHLLTELMGGELSLRSEVGQGSTFTVRLYLREVDRPTSMRVRDLKPIVGYLEPRRTLLVVDDQPIQRQLLASLLIPLGFVLREAASGSECLEILRQYQPDAILLDINMDDINGWQTAQQIRAQAHEGRNVPILIVSANPFENRPERLEAAQCQGFVSKPVIESELLDLLARVLQIEWVHERDLPSAPTRPPAGPLQASEPLPDALREDLLRMARMGNASGLRALLRSSAETMPAHAEQWQHLLGLVDRFDFSVLMEYLKECDPDASEH